MALMADDGFARAIFPSHTQGDGDTVFALATGQWTGEVDITPDRRARRGRDGPRHRPRRHGGDRHPEHPGRPRPEEVAAT